MDTNAMQGVTRTPQTYTSVEASKDTTMSNSCDASNAAGSFFGRSVFHSVGKRIMSALTYDNAKHFATESMKLMGVRIAAQVVFGASAGVPAMLLFHGRDVIKSCIRTVYNRPVMEHLSFAALATLAHVVAQTTQEFDPQQRKDLFVSQLYFGTAMFAASVALRELWDWYSQPKDEVSEEIPVEERVGQTLIIEASKEAPVGESTGPTLMIEASKEIPVEEEIDSTLLIKVSKQVPDEEGTDTALLIEASNQLPVKKRNDITLEFGLTKQAPVEEMIDPRPLIEISKQLVSANQVLINTIEDAFNNPVKNPEEKSS